MNGSTASVYGFVSTRTSFEMKPQELAALKKGSPILPWIAFIDVMHRSLIGKRCSANNSSFSGFPSLSRDRGFQQCLRARWQKNHV